MKTFKFLCITALFLCFISVSQLNAQVIANDKGTEMKELIYNVDGDTYAAYAALEWHMVITPSGRLNWEAHGFLTDMEVWKWDPENPEAQYGGWILIDYLPLPKKTIDAYDPWAGEEEVIITPNGKVHVNAKIVIW